MVGHQHLGMELAMLTPPDKVGLAILVTEETGAAILAVLHDVQRYAVDEDARMPEYGASLAAGRAEGLEWRSGFFQPLRYRGQHE